jgi:hypothetical protein
MVSLPQAKRCSELLHQGWQMTGMISRAPGSASIMLFEGRYYAIGPDGKEKLHSGPVYQHNYDTGEDTQLVCQEGVPVSGTPAA